MTTDYNYKAKIIRLVDADTVIANIDKGFRDWQEFALRLYGIDAPERFTDAGKLATAHLTGLLEGKGIRVDTYIDKQDKYGRYLATIWADGVNVNLKMVEDGHAVERIY